MSLPANRWKIIAFVIIGILGLTACDSDSNGGKNRDDNSGAVAPPAPTLSLTPQSVKTFAFSWADVSGETEYRLLENADGNSGYTAVTSIAANTTSYEHVVFLPARVNTSYILQACNSHGCTDSAAVFVTGTLAAAIGYVKASNTGSGDYFGAVALSDDGNTLAVGAPGESSDATGVGGDQTNNGANDSGAVYVFIRSGAVWTQQAYLKASNTGTNDEFGYSVALTSDGDSLAVGAPRESSNATGVGGDQTNDGESESGAVYIFNRIGTDWSQQAYLKASNPESGDGFGTSLALASDGNTLAVGAPREASNATGVDGDYANNDASESGAVYVFSLNGSDWSQQAYLKSSNSEAGDWFGISVALSGDGNTLVAGAHWEDSNAIGVGGEQTDNESNSSGAVYVFSRNSAIWNQQAYLKASNTGERDRFGWNVALSSDGDTLAVGAIYEDSNAIGVDGDQNNDGAENSGAAYIFTRSGNVWSQQAYLKASNTGVEDRFGFSVALSSDGDTVVVGAPEESSSTTGVGGDGSNNGAYESGAVYVFSRAGTIWLQLAYLKASNTEGGDPDLEESEAFGIRLAISGDGNTLAVGAAGEGSNATGLGGDQTNNSNTNSGAVYLY
ncbi:hypothetical protein ACFOSD_02700 [Salinispirillum marinum]|uniref:Integrin n=2 Tax=Saccharospirillaceae TaxID=255527 RepID=A0ABV8BDY5_9GAMM